MKTVADISAARILALGLAGPIARSPQDVVTHLMCMQGQMLGGVLASVALRTPDRRLTAVRQALNDGLLVRSWTQRGTIHLVATADVSWVLDLTADRMLQSSARRRAELGIDETMFHAASNIVTDLIRLDGPVTRPMLLTALGPLDLGEVPGREYHLITMLAMRQVIVQGPLADGDRVEQLFALSTALGDGRRLPRNEAVVEFMTRYAISHGPVTIADAARWAGLTVKDARAGITAGIDAGDLAATDINEARYFHAPELPDLLVDHRDEANELLLLPGFDELILGYKDRSATLTTADEQRVVPGRNGMFKNTLVHRTRAIGTWLKSARVGGSRIDITPFPGQRINTRAVDRALGRHPVFVRP